MSRSPTTVLPRRLGRRCRIGAFTPSDMLENSHLDSLEVNRRILDSLGIEILVKEQEDDGDSSLFGGRRQATEINCWARDESIHGMWATRGGKTSNSCLPYVDFESILSSRKIVIGFSDTCVLLNAIAAKTGLVTFYGPNVLTKLKETAHSNLAELKRPHRDVTRHWPGSITVRGGSVEGRLIGGNLSTFTVTNSGTEFEPKFGSSILLWESRSADWRKVEQYFHALDLRGSLANVGGVIVGLVGLFRDFGCLEGLRVIKNTFGALGVPVLMVPSFGHDAVENPIWPIGGLVKLDATDQKVTFLEPFVS